MNMTNVKRSITLGANRSVLTLQKYSPEILLTAGIVGGIVAAVMAAKATLKADPINAHHAVELELLEIESTEQGYSKEDELKARAQIYARTGLDYAKLYGPAVGVGVASITAILYSHGIMRNRQGALVAAYSLLAEGFRQYQTRVIEEYGEDADAKIRDHILVHKDDVVDEDDTNPLSSITIYDRFFDEGNHMWRKDRQLNKAFLLSEQNYANDLLQIKGHVFLNEIYERLGFPQTPYGQLVGWVLKSPKQMAEEKRDGYVDFGITDMSRKATREFVNETNPTLLLTFNVDGVVFDLI